MIKVKIGTKTHQQVLFPCSIFREGMKQQKIMDELVETNIYEEENLDNMLSFIVRVFQDKITAEDLENNLSFIEIMQLYMECLQNCGGDVKQKMSQLAKK